MTPLLVLGALAGDPDPACESVLQADAVVEVGFTKGGEYPAAHRRKRWEPPPAEIAKTVATGKVLEVWKGDAALASVQPGVDWLQLADQAPTWWDRFFSGEPFSALVVLKKAESGWKAVDMQACQVSWCWDELRAQVAACLGRELPAEAPPPPPRDEGWFSSCGG